MVWVFLDFYVMQLDEIKGIVSPELKQLDSLIGTSLQSEIELINQISHYMMQGKGKRLRPLIVLLCAKACGYEGQLHLAIAAAIEFIHTATLLHDDVIDESTMRRGHKTANYKWDNKTAVLVGDFLYSRAFQLMLTTDNINILKTIADATNTIAEGEILQLLNQNNAKATEESYLKVIQYKTAKLFESAAETAAILANCSPELQQVLAQFGLHLGIAYQLVDDILDFQQPQECFGKNIGDDLAGGNPTLPIIYLMQHGSYQEKVLIQQAIENGDSKSLGQIQDAIAKSNAKQYIMHIANNEAKKAKQLIYELQDSKYKQATIALIDFIVTREY